MEYQQPTCEICGNIFVPDGRRKARCSDKHERSCSVCEKIFEVKPSNKPSKEFCSRACSNKSRIRVNTCVICNTEFHKISQTCSSSCANKLRVMSMETKTCELCNKSFTPSSSTQRFCKEPHSVSCAECGTVFTISDPLSKRRFCSSKCASLTINGEDANKKRSATSLKNYGTTSPHSTDELKAKIVQSNLDKYGVAHPMQLESTKSKVVQTNRKKYGVDHVLQVPEIRAKIEQTNLKRYGVTNPSKSDEIVKKISETFMERYGVPWANQSEEVSAKRVQTNLDRYGVPNVMMLPENVEKSNATFADSVNSGRVHHRKASQLNQHLAKRLLELPYVSKVQLEVPFGRFTADLQVNDTLLIDLNPTVSHNAFRSFACLINNCVKSACGKHSTVANNYHQKRAQEASSLNLSLIQLYDWNTDEEIVELVKSKLDRSFTKLTAKKLQLKKISQKTANSFLNNNHIQGGTKQQSHCYGLFDNDNLLAVATFGPSRFNKNYDYEFIRYAVKTGYIIHGASVRLFKAFIKDLDAEETVSGSCNNDNGSEKGSPLSVISYVDFDHTTKPHTFLNTLGFKEVSATRPALVWFNVQKQHKVNNLSVTTIGADRILGTQYGSVEESGLDNKGIMLEEGYLPVYTSGNRVFVWQGRKNK